MHAHACSHACQLALPLIMAEAGNPTHVGGRCVHACMHACRVAYVSDHPVTSHYNNYAHPGADTAILVLFVYVFLFATNLSLLLSSMTHIPILATTLIDSSTTSIKSPYSAQESTGSAADEETAAAAALSADPSSQTASLSSTTGCYISGPLMPPAGYPMPRVGGRPDQSPPQQHMMQQEQCEQHQRLGEQQRIEQEEHQRDQQHQHLHQQHQQQHLQQRQQQQHHSQQLPFDDPRSSVISSSSSGGSSKPNSVKDKDQPPPPQWAQPPKPTGTPGPRASSFDSGLDRNVLFNPEHIRGPAGEWVEVLRGEQGRIAIKSTPTQYEVLVWLPGFS